MKSKCSRVLLAVEHEAEHDMEWNLIDIFLKSTDKGIESPRKDIRLLEIGKVACECLYI
jgi:hypothetical protein